MASNLRVDSIVPATGTNVSIGTVTGGVNIPGVLTYEDVTNVDSIGVVTARSGINVVGNDLNVGSNIKLGNASGIVTASHFYGNGANLTGIVALPAGMIAPFAMTTPPTGWLECNGAAISRSTYATLFAAIGTVHGAGDGSSTFNLPDLRASFIRGFDNSRGVDSGRSFGSFQDQGLPAMKGRVQDSHGQAAINSSQEGSFTNVFTNGGGQSSYRSALQTASTSYKYVLFDSTNVIPDASAGGLRPKNLALMYMIKI